VVTAAPAVCSTQMVPGWWSNWRNRPRGRVVWVDVTGVSSDVGASAVGSALSSQKRPTSLRLLTVVVAVTAQMSCGAARDRASLDRLADEEFWALSTSLSESAGEFPHDENLVSNEMQFAVIAQRLGARGGVYIGVGPEQNFSYIARLQPRLAFVVDIRQENRDLHLMYKALFEISADRADFLARLFSRERPVAINRQASVDDLFDGVAAARPSARVFAETTRLIRAHLLEARGFPLTVEQLQSIDNILDAFFKDGPEIRYGRSLPPDATRPSYRSLMTARDLRGRPRSYLSTENAFAFVKQLHARNAIVPVVGDFAGPSALRRVGDYVRTHRAVVGAFYSSNVEVYLTRDQRRAFCASLAALPHDAETWFLTGRGLEPLAAKLRACAAIAPSLHWPPAA
jgi:hypothetical protein